MRRSRYNTRNLINAIRNPSLLVDELNQSLRTLLVQNLYDGDNFMEEDWDNLIILDACRPGFFQQYHPFNGELSYRTSLGASSAEFFFNNFKGNRYYDTVYVTGNPNVRAIDDDSIYKVVKTFSESHDHHKGWLPETTLDVALKTYEKHPNKRLAVHFMQPHAPYLGEFANDLRQRVTEEYDVRFTYARNDNEDPEATTDQINLLHAYKHGYISKDEIREVYAENLCLVLEHVEKLLDTIEGKTVITSDHSESLGDFKGIFGRIYGHKEYALSKKLREVPWLVLNGSRRDTYAENPVESISVEEDVVRENLRDLGYIQE